MKHKSLMMVKKAGKASKEDKSTLVLVINSSVNSLGLILPGSVIKMFYYAIAHAG